MRKRGIPGVNSDAYHFGFFEDRTGLKTAPPSHSQFEPLLEAIYIFGGLVLIFGIISFACFSLREYIYSFKTRENRSNSSVWSDSPNVLDQRDANNEELIESIANHAYPNLTQEQVRKRLEIRQSIDLEKFDRQMLFTPLDVVQISPNHQNNNTTDYDSLNDDILIPLKSAITKTIYTIRELLAMKPAEYDGIPLTVIDYNQGSQNDIKSELKFATGFQHVDFVSMRNAEKTIQEIRNSITKRENHNTIRWVQMFRLIVIAANAIDGENPNIYLKQFNRFMDELIDAGLIFEFLNESNSYFSRSLIQMVLQYCYCHWNFEKDIPLKVNQKFQRWKQHARPEIQSHTVVFRFLINLQLGFAILEVDKDTSQLTHNKLETLIKLVLKDSSCSDIMGMIELLYQAYEVSTTIESRRVFFEVLYLLLKSHKSCCCSSIFNGENSALKYLMKVSLYNEEADREIRHNSKKIYSLALTKNENIDQIWCDIKKEVSPENTNTTKASNKTITKSKDIPGSWKSGKSS